MSSNHDLLVKAKAQDTQARQQLVENNVGLVWSIVRRYSDRGYELDDLFQIGCLGLIKAIDRFDLSYDVMFSTYAIPMIQGEIKRFLRDDGMIKVSRIAKQNNQKIKNARAEFENEHMREPTIEEISNICGLEKEEIVMAMESDYKIDSLYRNINESGTKDIMIMDVIKDKKDDIQSTIDRISVNQMLSQLEDKERDIIKMRYFDNMTQSQVAKIYGVSQVKISRLESGIIKKLRIRAGC